jgi:hypothetical protein
LQKPIHEAGAVAKKAVYGSEGMPLGMGCHSLLLCGGSFLSFIMSEIVIEKRFIGLLLTRLYAHVEACVAPAAGLQLGI